MSDRIRPGDSFDVFGHKFRLDEKGATQHVKTPKPKSVQARPAKAAPAPSFDVSAWLWNEARRAVVEAWPKMAHGPVYLYFARGRLALADDRPDGMELGHAMRVPNKTQDATVAWVVENSGRLACIPEVA